jgi:transposase
MRQALLDDLWMKPSRYLDELVVFLSDEFDVLVSTSAISRELKSAGWSKKKARQEAKQRNPDLPDYYLHDISSYDPDHPVFVDKSGCDKRSGFRRTAWSPLGVTPVHIARFQRGQRYQILPAYTLNGVLLSRVFQGSTDSSFFEDFIEQLLTVCGRWSERQSVMVMDNASFYHSARIKQICSDAGVKLSYLPPYSPDLNPIEEFFAELKAFIKRNWVVYEENGDQDFPAFLQ